MTQSQTITPAQEYQEYYGPAMFEPLTRELLRRAKPQRGARGLDIACGTGIVTRALAAALGESGAVTGVDINPGMIAVAREIPSAAGAPIEWLEGDGTALGLPDGTVDLVTCQQGLQFFSDRAAGLAEMHRVLAPGGRLAVATWRGEERHPIFEALTEAELPELARFGVPMTREQATRPFSLGDPVELRRLLDGAGFREVEVEEHEIQARFATADRFVERLEYAYAAVIPQFIEDPDAFERYLRSVVGKTQEVVERYRDGDSVVFPMFTNIAVATR